VKLAHAHQVTNNMLLVSAGLVVNVAISGWIPPLSSAFCE
jgi:hypothetical protein